MAIHLQRTFFSDHQKEITVNLVHRAGKTSIDSTPGSNALWGFIKRICNTISNTFRSVDGIDETLLPLGQLLSPTAQAALSLAVVGVGTPFVFLGAKGAVTEMLERFHERIPETLEHMLQQCNEIENLLRERHGIQLNSSELSVSFDDCQSGLELIQLSGTVARKCEAFLRLLDTLPDTDRNQLENDAQLVQLVTQFGQDMNILSAELVNRNASPLGAYAMMGMTAGMVLLCAQSIAKLIELKSITAAATAVADNVMTGSTFIGSVAGMVFLPAQVAMAGYGAGCAVAGIKHDNIMKKDSAALQALQQHDSFLSAETPALSEAVTTALELVKEKRHFNKQHSTLYGSITAVGQSLMTGYTAGTLLISAGVITATAAPVVVGAMAAVGVPLTLSMAANRIIYKHKESNFLGEKASESARTRAAEFTQHKIINSSDASTVIGPEQAIQATAGEITRQQRWIAESKLHSIINKVLVKARKNNAETTAENLHQQVENEIKKIIDNKGKYFKRQHTTLLKIDLQLMDRCFKQDYGMDFFQGGIDKIQENLNEKVIKNLSDSELTLSDNRVNKVLQQTVKKLTKITDDTEINTALQGNSFTVADMQQLSEQSNSANDIMGRKLTRAVIKQHKTDSKFLRDQGTGNLITLAKVFNQGTEIKHGTVSNEVSSAAIETTETTLLPEQAS